MTVALLPLEYFPPLHSVALMAAVDRVVWADTWPYRRQTRQNRSKLRNPNGWQWISLPMWSHQHGRPAREVQVDGNVPWHERHWRAFMYNYRSTMYFEYFEDDFKPFFDTPPQALQPIAESTTRITCAFAQVETPFVRASELGADTLNAIQAETGAANLWIAHEHASQLGIATDDGASSAEGDLCTVLPPYDHPTYRQNFEGFESGMGAIDCLFNYGPEAIRIMTDGLTAPEAS
ncbi:MAG: WbqC family protein [Longimonas sp.]|uniref:WbqC family protein n=1 Tax=Longimonas sp. TaxID=2039626 RepID=UPI003350F002